MPFESEEKYTSEVCAHIVGLAAATQLINSLWTTEVTPTYVLLVEDNPGDVFPLREAFLYTNPSARLHVVGDGEEAMAFLKHGGIHVNAPWPDLILLDLNIPKLNGLEVLTQIKMDQNLRMIPVAIWSSSENPSDVAQCYLLDANCYFYKPARFDEFEHLVELINDFWLTKVRLPSREHPTPLV